MPRRITRRLAVAPEFRDIDIMGVVHNCVYFEWFERGRLSIMNEVLSLDDAAASTSPFPSSKIRANTSPP